MFIYVDEFFRIWSDLRAVIFLMGGVIRFGCRALNFIMVRW